MYICGCTQLNILVIYMICNDQAFIVRSKQCHVKPKCYEGGHCITAICKCINLINNYYV